LIRAVLDTNVLISGVIRPLGVAGDILWRLREGKFALVYTEPILVELAEVMNRPRMRGKYGLESEDIETTLALVLLRGEPAVPTRRISVCRDPTDNMILEAAIAGHADLISSGDDDLLSLQEFEGIPIIAPAEFLGRLAKGTA
jgi:putative PIN family toxin of toxin-antitoxin system